MHLLDKPQSPQPRLSSSKGGGGGNAKKKEESSGGGGGGSLCLPKDDFHIDVKV